MTTATDVRLVHLRLDRELLRWLDHQKVDLDAFPTRTALIEAVLQSTRMKVEDDGLDLANDLAEHAPAKEPEVATGTSPAMGRGGI